jgi:hypothetical protein
MVHKDIEKEFIEKMKAKLVKAFGDDPKTSEDYGRVR